MWLRARIDDRLREVTRSPDPSMDEMASHLVAAGGKRLRPILAALASVTSVALDELPANPGSVLDRVGEDAVTGGVAVELVHAGSLHHDDVIDEAETRHGVPSVNARWGNLRAILSGDFLLARASELAASLGTEVAGLLAATIGRLCEGEVHELRFAYRLDRSEEDYYEAIEGKTAALYAAATRIGGLVAGQSRDRVDALTEFGRLYGMAFQIVDDVLDVVETDEKLGKPAGHDMTEGVYTLPVLKVLQGPDSDRVAAELRELLGKPLDDASRLRALELVRNSTGVASSLEAAGGFVAKAIERLVPLGSGPAIDVLAAGARSLVTDL